MLYAIGEIFLVVIGILIALQINNWNEARKQDDLEFKFLQRMVVDLENDTTYYDKRIAYNKSSIVNLERFLFELYENQENANDVRRLLSRAIVDTDDLNTHNSTYVELTNTGNLSIVQNERVKTSIVDYYRLNSELGSNIHEFNNITTQLLIGVLESTPELKYILSLHKDPKRYLESDWQFLNEPSSEKFQKMESSVSFFYLRVKEHLGYFNRLKVSSKQLIDLINEELDG